MPPVIRRGYKNKFKHEVKSCRSLQFQRFKISAFQCFLLVWISPFQYFSFPCFSFSSPVATTNLIAASRSPPRARSVLRGPLNYNDRPHHTR